MTRTTHSRAPIFLLSYSLSFNARWILESIVPVWCYNALITKCRCGSYVSCDHGYSLDWIVVPSEMILILTTRSIEGIPTVPIYARRWLGGPLEVRRQRERKCKELALQPSSAVSGSLNAGGQMKRIVRVRVARVKVQKLSVWSRTLLIYKYERGIMTDVANIGNGST